MTVLSLLVNHEHLDCTLFIMGCLTVSISHLIYGLAAVVNVTMKFEA